MRTDAGQRGQVLPLIALCLGTLMGFGGIGVDVGFLEYRQQAQQVATDAAAAGGAEALLHAGCPNQSAAQTSASADSTRNGFQNGVGNVIVTVQNPPTSGPFAGDSCAVYVNIQAQQVPTFFTRLFAFGSNGAAETTQAVAIVSASSNDCIYLLSPTTQAIFNNVTVNAPGCAIAINGTANFNGGTVASPSIGVVGAVTDNGTSFPEASPQAMLPVSDPCPGIPGCAYLTNNPPSTNGCQNYQKGSGSYTITPGCYSGINLNGSNVTFSAGLYVFTGSIVLNNATIQGSGVTWYVTSTGTPPNFNGQTVNLSPPASGNYDGVLYYQVAGNTKNPNFNGNADSLKGLIYAPSANGVIFNGNSGGYLVMVVGSANWNGGSTYDFATPPPGQSLIQQAVVAE